MKFSIARNNIFQYMLSGIWTILFIFGYLTNSSGQNDIFLAWLCIVISIHSILKVKNHLYLLIIYGFIGYCNYSICMAQYIAPVSSFFTQWVNTKVSSQGLNILVFATLLFNYIAPYIRTLTISEPLTKNNRNNAIISLGIWIVLALIGIFAFGRPDMAGERGSPSALYEYSIILVIIGSYFSGQSRFLQVLYWLVILGFSGQNFVYGGRVTGLQLILCGILCFHAHRFNWYRLIPIALGAIFLGTFIGIMRANVLSSALTFTSISNNLIQNKFVLDTAYASYFASLTFLAVIPMISWQIRLVFLGKFLIYIFAGQQLVDANVAAFTRQFFIHYFGGGGILLLFLAWYNWSYFFYLVFKIFMETYYTEFREIIRNSTMYKYLYNCHSITMVSICTESTV